MGKVLDFPTLPSHLKVFRTVWKNDEGEMETSSYYVCKTVEEAKEVFLEAYNEDGLANMFEVFRFTEGEKMMMYVNQESEIYE